MWYVVFGDILISVYRPSVTSVALTLTTARNSPCGFARSAARTARSASLFETQLHCSC